MRPKVYLPAILALALVSVGILVVYTRGMGTPTQTRATDYNGGLGIRRSNAEFPRSLIDDALKAPTVFSQSNFRKGQQAGKANSSVNEYESVDHSQPHDNSKCPDLLKGMATGRWLTRPLTDFEQTSMDIYLQTERSAFKIPPTFQRRDGRCGANITYEETPQYNHMWFKSICNPKGPTPCCKTDKCVDLPVEECRCPTCFDERQVIHAEFSTWQPSDSRCQSVDFSKEEACKVLDGATIHVIGDSYVREVYIALAIILTGNHVDGALKDGLKKELRNQCLGLFQITGAPCRYVLNEDRKLCNDRVHIKYTEVWNARDVNRVTSAVSELLTKPKSMVMMGLGIHDNFNHDFVKKVYFNPLLSYYESIEKQIKRNTGKASRVEDNNSTLNIETSHEARSNTAEEDQYLPHLFWMGIHAPGLLKSPHFYAQSADGVKSFNKFVATVLDGTNIPYLETFNFTSGVSSFDGTHYGWAINMLKANMMLTYIRDVLEPQGLWK